MAHRHPEVILQLNFSDLIDRIGIVPLEHGLNPGKNNIRIIRERVGHLFEGRESV